MATINLIGDFTAYKVQDCAFSISDARTAKTINEFGRTAANLAVVEDFLTIKEKAGKHAVKKVFGMMFLEEKRVKNIQPNKNESLNFADAFRRSGRFSLLLKEPVYFVEKNIKKTNKPFCDFLALDDKLFKQACINANEVLSVEDFFDKTAVVFLDFAEKVAVIPKANRDIGVNYHELFVIFSNEFRVFEASKKETVSIAGSFSEKSMFNREFAEKIYSSSKTVKEYGFSQKEFFELTEAYIRHANAVISDISLGLGEMTLQGFLDKTSSPPGYDRFIDFIVGEYEYKDALVRMVIEAGSAKAEPLIYDMSVNVDIDDTVDRGTAQITDTTKPATIKFNKHYYHPPEVGVTLKGGMGTDIITVEIVEIREDGFDVSIYNSSKVRVTGFVTWTAVGY